MNLKNISLPYSTQTTPFYLVTLIVALEVILALSYIGIKFGVEFVNSVFSLGLSTLQISTALFIFFTFLQVTLLVYVILNWVNTIYEINDKEVVYKTGIIGKRARAYDMSNVQSSYVEQSILGRIFNFGKVTLYSPALKNDLFFNDVPNPQRFKAAVDLALIPEGEKSSTYLRRFS
ncbi:MAG: PH domain-containing protein [Romboutsia sp.]|nr:PH domain-containing protein [Romboutsia sp.]